MQNCVAMITSWTLTRKDVTQDAASSGNLPIDHGTAFLALGRPEVVGGDSITVKRYCFLRTPHETETRRTLRTLPSTRPPS